MNGKAPSEFPPCEQKDAIVVMREISRSALQLWFPLSFVLLMLLSTTTLHGQKHLPTTYCNPLNLNYAYNAIPRFVEQGNHRTTADPVITLFKDNYFLFSTNQYGYWWSTDLAHWKFVPRRFLKFQIEAFNENGIGPRSSIIKVE